MLCCAAGSRAWAGLTHDAIVEAVKGPWQLAVPLGLPPVLEEMMATALSKNPHDRCDSVCKQVTQWSWMAAIHPCIVLSLWTACGCFVWITQRVRSLVWVYFSVGACGGHVVRDIWWALCMCWQQLVGATGGCGVAWEHSLFFTSGEW